MRCRLWVPVHELVIAVVIMIEREMLIRFLERADIIVN
jgi:hypothetical protein